MKTHRQIKTSKSVGDPSSKYSYSRSLDDDYENKIEVIEWAENKIYEELEKLIINQINYNEGTMSREQKWKCIQNAALKLKDKYLL